MRNIHHEVKYAVSNNIPFSISRWTIVAQAMGFGMNYRLEDLPLLHEFEGSMIQNVITQVYWNAIMELKTT